MKTKTKFGILAIASIIISTIDRVNAQLPWINYPGGGGNSFHQPDYNTYPDVESP